ncbi:MAG: hypothetical protein KBD94_06070 [Pyrinomonadaceae bacterium]|nr:hypothetical protein [Pyrinomonadaceae bacterium]
MQRISEQQILKSLGSCYEAARTATYAAWLDLWKQLAVTFRSGFGGFVFYRPGDHGDDGYTAIITDTAPALLDKYLKKFQSKSPLRKAMSSLKAGERFNRQDHISDEEFVKTEIYDGFYKPARIFHVEFHLFLVKSGMHGAVIFTRPEGEPNFDAEDVAAIRVLLPHLERAFQFYADLQDAGVKDCVMSAAFDRVSTRVIIANAALDMVFCNNGARETLDGRDGLEVDGNGRLRTHLRADGLLLCERIKSITGDGHGDADEVVMVTRPSGRRPLAVLVAPVDSGTFHSFSDQRLAMLFVSDPEQSAQAVDDVLVRMYGLTRAEARFAALLAEVSDVKTVCDLLGVRITTGRTHLSRIFAKTGANRQAALIKLILSGPASIQ